MDKSLTIRLYSYYTYTNAFQWLGSSERLGTYVTYINDIGEPSSIG